MKPKSDPIRLKLNRYGLETVPDFEYEYLDGQIGFAEKKGKRDAAVASIGEPNLDTSNPKRPGAPVLSPFVFLDTMPKLPRLHELLISETSDQVIVDHAGRLHERIANRRPDELEAAPDEVFAHCHSLR